MDMLTDEKQTLLDEELQKVGKTVGKLLEGVLAFLGEKALPIIIQIGAALLESWSKKVLKKNGINVE